MKCIIFFIIIVLFINKTNSAIRRLPNNQNENNRMEVVPISKNMYIYSSFYYVDNNIIKILGYSKNSSIDNITCIITYDNKTKRKCSISCKIVYKININFLVLKIQLYSKMKYNSIYINNKLIKSIKIINSSKKYNCTLCITKFINYTAETYLLEAITAYRLAGIDHLVIYYISSSSSVLNILKYYRSIKYVDIISWNYFHEIHFLKKYVYGQLWKYNDCFYRYKYLSKTLLFNDLDEVLWINGNITIQSLIYNSNYNNYDALYLYNRIFMKEFYSNNNYNNSRLIPYDRYYHYIPDFSMFQYHNSCTYRKGYLSKYLIINYTKIEYIGIHDILVYTKKIDITYINKNIAFLRHTRRVREDLLKDCYKWNNYYSCKENFIAQVVKNTKKRIC